MNMEHLEFENSDLAEFDNSQLDQTTDAATGIYIPPQ